jgi:hypothetical protein
VRREVAKALKLLKRIPKEAKVIGAAEMAADELVRHLLPRIQKLRLAGKIVIDTNWLIVSPGDCELFTEGYELIEVSSRGPRNYSSGSMDLDMAYAIAEWVESRGGGERWLNWCMRAMMRHVRKSLEQKKLARWK